MSVWSLSIVSLYTCTPASPMCSGWAGAATKAWTQAAGQHLAINAMTLGPLAHRIPCFAGDLNDHIIVHTRRRSRHKTWELHVAKHTPNNVGRSQAVACMRRLLEVNLELSNITRGEFHTATATHRALHFQIPCVADASSIEQCQQCLSLYLPTGHV